MKLFLDHDVYASTAVALRDAGHDVVVAGDVGLGRASDTDLLLHAHRDGRVLLTRDRDYGSLVFAGGLSAGVIYLRLTPATLDAVHDELRRVLDRNTQDDLLHAFVVVEAGRHRYRHLPPDPLEQI